MSHPQDPRKEALSDEERELARIARALPASGPSPELDRRILDAARRAVDAPSRRRHPGWRWGFGASAAAVLVVALIWPQLPTEQPVPRPSTHMGERERRVDAQVSPAEPSALEDRAEPAAPLGAQAESAQPAFEATAVDEVAPMAVEGPRRAPPFESEAIAPAPPAPPMPTELGQEALRQPVTATASPKRDAKALPPFEDDLKLAPEEWIERIRERLAVGDEDGARRSLAAFVHRHPDHALPDDLQHLRE